ncbi:MAG: hypothetical protein D6704_06695 [Nitrospirae bacterium]|nr:MAG: hypothetical protein D6704_06695 [Nitrospirota bacterium]
MCSRDKGRAPLIRLVIATATRWEFAAIRRAVPSPTRTRSWLRIRGVESWTPSLHVLVIQTGIGTANAKVACRAIVETGSWDLLISSGFAGALVPAKIGDLVIPLHVLTCSQAGDSGTACPAGSPHPFFEAAALQTAQELGQNVVQGPLLTVPHMVWQAVEKRALANQTGGVAVDMESAAISQVAQERNIPFVAVRSVSDTWTEDLPLDLNVFRESCWGWLKGAGLVGTHPQMWRGFSRLKDQMRCASSTLTAFFSAFLRRVS